MLCDRMYLIAWLLDMEYMHEYWHIFFAEESKWIIE